MEVTSEKEFQIFSSESELLLNASESWTYKIGDIVSEIFRTSAMQVTKVRASLTGGGYKCYWTLSFFYNGTSYKIPFGIMCSLDLLNAQKGILATFPIDARLACENKPFYFQSNFDPDIYDIIKCVRFTIPATVWQGC